MKSNSTASAAEQVILAIPSTSSSSLPTNARKTAVDKTAYAELEASIMAHGLPENLVVGPESESRVKGKFAVIAGGRRLKAFNAISVSIISL